MKKLICTICASVLFFPAVVNSSITDKTEALEVSGRFLTEITSGNYEVSWLQSSEILKRLKPLEIFIHQQQNNKFLFGEVVDRSDFIIKERTSMALLPDGQYLLLVYKTEFEKKKSALELLTILKEADGVWRVVDYEVR